MAFSTHAVFHEAINSCDYFCIAKADISKRVILLYLKACLSPNAKVKVEVIKSVLTADRSCDIPACLHCNVIQLISLSI